MAAATPKWFVVANVAESGNSKLRVNARVVVIDTSQWNRRGNTSVRDRVQVRGLSFGGRPISVWIAIKQLHNMRTAREMPAGLLRHRGYADRGYDDRETADRIAAALSMTGPN